MAALTVIASHLVFTFYSYLWAFTPLPPDAYTAFERFLQTTPARALYDGGLAVYLFWVHSGFVLAYGFLRSGRQRDVLQSAAIRRYIRLTIPLAASIALAYVLLKSGAISKTQIHAAPPLAFLDRFYNFEPDALSALYQMFWGTYFYFDATTSYNTVLWTISVELLGSFLIYAHLALTATARKRWLFYGVVLFLFRDAPVGSMVTGMVLADVYWTFIREKTFPVVLPIFLCAVGIYIGTFRSLEFALWRPLQFVFTTLSETQHKTVAATLIIVSLLTWPGAQKLLSGSIPQLLGKRSYALYLFHLPLLTGIAPWVYVHGPGSHHLNAATATGVYLAALFVVSAVASEYIDQPAIRLGKTAYRRFFSPDAPIATPHR